MNHRQASEHLSEMFLLKLKMRLKMAIPSKNVGWYQGIKREKGILLTCFPNVNTFVSQKLSSGMDSAAYRLSPKSSCWHWPKYKEKHNSFSRFGSIHWIGVRWLSRVVYINVSSGKHISRSIQKVSSFFFLVVMVVVLYLGIIIIFFTDSSIKQRLYFLKHTVFIQGLQQLVEALEEESTQQSLGPSVSLLW